MIDLQSPSIIKILTNKDDTLEIVLFAQPTISNNMVSRKIISYHTIEVMVLKMH